MQFFLISISGYLVNGSQHIPKIYNITYNDTITIYQVDITGLYPATTYYFSLTGCTTVGCGANHTLVAKIQEMGK